MFSLPGLMRARRSRRFGLLRSLLVRGPEPTMPGAFEPLAHALHARLDWHQLGGSTWRLESERGALAWLEWGRKLRRVTSAEGTWTFTGWPWRLAVVSGDGRKVCRWRRTWFGHGRLEFEGAETLVWHPGWRGDSELRTEDGRVILSFAPQRGFLTFSGSIEPSEAARTRGDLALLAAWPLVLMVERTRKTH